VSGKEIEYLGEITLCLRVDRKPIGFGSLLIQHQTSQAEIVGLYIDPEYRGKGYARQLIEELIKIAHNKGLNEVMITCELDDVTMNHLAESLGFSKWNKWVLRK